METFKKFIRIIRHLSLSNQVLILILFCLMNSLLEVISLALILPILKTLSEPKLYTNAFNSKVFEFTEIKTTLEPDQLITLISISLLIIITIKFFFSIFFEWFKAKSIYLLEFRLTKKIYNRYLKLSYTDILNTSSSDIQRSILNDVSQFYARYQVLIQLITDLIFVFAITVLLLLNNFELSLMIIFLLLMISLVYLKFTYKKSYELGKSLTNSYESKIKLMLQSLLGIQEIIIYNSSSFFIRLFNKINSQVFSDKKNFSIITSIPKPLIEFLILLIFVLILLIYDYFNYETHYVISELGFLAVAIIRLAPSSYRIINYVQKIKFTDEPVKKMYSHIIFDEKEFDLNDEQIIYDYRDEINFEKISFYYLKDKYILKDCDISIKPKVVTGIFGESGSGKSTFVNILSGLQSVKSGKFLIGNIEIKQSNLASLRSNIGYVPQNVFILDDTLEKNIAFGLDHEKINKEKLNKAIEFAGLKKFVNDIKEGVEVSLGEMGNKLSGGQKQRIGIARAIYKGAKILIFDESTSALDNKTESEVLENIFKLKNQFTIILVSHKTSIINKCDQIYFLENSKFKLINKV